MPFSYLARPVLSVDSGPLAPAPLGADVGRHAVGGRLALAAGAPDPENINSSHQTGNRSVEKTDTSLDSVMVASSPASGGGSADEVAARRPTSIAKSLIVRSSLSVRLTGYPLYGNDCDDVTTLIGRRVSAASFMKEGT